MIRVIKKDVSEEERLNLKIKDHIDFLLAQFSGCQNNDENIGLLNEMVLSALKDIIPYDKFTNPVSYGLEVRRSPDDQHVIDTVIYAKNIFTALLLEGYGPRTELIGRESCIIYDEDKGVGPMVWVLDGDRVIKFRSLLLEVES